jgi:hypothetical protein
VKLLTFPFRLLFRLIVLPIKLLFATLGLTLRTGFKVGTLPVKGGAVATRALGFKAIVLFALGVAGGVALTKRFGAQLGILGPEDDAASFGFGDSGPVVVDDTVTIETTPDGGAVIIEDTVVVEETPDGEVVTETITVDEMTAAEVEAVVEAELEAEIAEAVEAEVEAEIEAEIAEALSESERDADDV